MTPHPDDERNYDDHEDCHFVQGRGWVENDAEDYEEERRQKAMRRREIDWPDTESE